MAGVAPTRRASQWSSVARVVSKLDARERRRYCETVKNITVSVDDETYRRARVRAAELDTSVSALVRAYLVELALEEPEVERLARRERELRDSITSFRAADRVSRAELHGRDRSP
jgi:plasmid stability protein